MLRRIQTLSNKQDTKTKVRLPRLLVNMIFLVFILFLLQTQERLGLSDRRETNIRNHPQQSLNVEIRFCGWDSNAILETRSNAAGEWLISDIDLDLIFQVELFFRAGNYNIDTGERATFTLKHFRPINNGHLAIAGQGKRMVKTNDQENEGNRCHVAL